MEETDPPGKVPEFENTSLKEPWNREEPWNADSARIVGNLILCGNETARDS